MESALEQAFAIASWKLSPSEAFNAIMQDSCSISDTHYEHNKRRYHSGDHNILSKSFPTNKG